MKSYPIKKSTLITSAIALIPSVTLALPTYAEVLGPLAMAENSASTLAKAHDSILSDQILNVEATETVSNSAASVSDIDVSDIQAESIIADVEFVSQANVSQLLSESDDLGQVTSVSQLSDVLPSDWAYQAVQSLVERYGCIAGYPDGTFRGNRMATRYELAAALNACLDQVSDRFASRDELETVKALQAEFATELATLRGRVDGLEARTDTLEANQFSTSTKLSGIAVMQTQFGDVTGDGFINSETNAAVNSGTTRPSVIAATILDFNTSFSGSDLLQVSLSAGNNGQDAASGLGQTLYPEASGNAGQPYFVTRGTSALTFYPSTVSLFRLAYTFKPTEDLSLTAGTQLYPNDFLDFNSYANNPFSDFNSYFFTNNPLIIPFAQNFLGGAGGGLNWNVDGGPVTVRATYVAANAASPTETVNGGGLFGDPYQASAEVEYADDFGSNANNNFAVRAQFTNSSTFDVEQNAVGLNAELTLGRFGVFGRYGYSDAVAEGTAVAPAGGRQDFTAHTWMAGLAYKDLIRPGSLLAASVGQPFINNLPATVSFGPNTSTQTNYEAFFKVPLGENISITPGIMVTTDANNVSGQPTLVQGYLRKTFSF